MRSAGEDTALVHAQRIGTREEFQLVGPYVHSRHHQEISWVAVFFTKYTIGGGQTPPVEYPCNGHISICRVRISQEKLDEAVARARHVVANLKAKGSRHWQGAALYDPEKSGNGAENYSWADISVHSPLHQTCFAVMHAISPRWPRVNFHASFDTRPWGEERVTTLAPPGGAGSSAD